MRQLNPKSALGAAAVATLLTLTAACSSSSGSSSGRSGAPSGPGGTHGASGSTITIGGVAPIASNVQSQPEIKAAEEAAVSSINAAGGVNGHPLKLDFCDTTDTANGEFTCMRKITEDKVAAIVAPNLIVDQSGRGLKYATAAGEPIVGSFGLEPADFSTPGVFPMSSGIPGWSYGQVVSLIKAGSKHIALFGDNEAGSQYILSFTQQAMKSAGITPVRYVKTDASSDPTFSQGAAKVIAGNVDGVIFDSSPTYGAKAVQALRSAGYKGPISSITGVYTPETVKALGAQGNNLYLSSQLALPSDTSKPGIAAFLAGMKKYQPSAEVDESSTNAWTAVQLFAQAAKTITGDVNAKSVLAAMNNISTPLNLGTIGPYQVKGAKPTGIAGYPRIFNPTVVLGVVKNGVLEPFDKGAFVNPFTTLKNLKSGK